MQSALSALFDFARRDVRPADIERGCPSDPGWSQSVAVFTRIWETGLPSQPAGGELLKDSFQLSQTIEFANYRDPEPGPAGDRFRRFRVFTNATGLLVPSVFVPEIPPLNQTLLRLFEDAEALHDGELTLKAQAAVAEFPDALEALGETRISTEQLLFVPLTLMLFRTLPGALPTELDLLAAEFHRLWARLAASGHPSAETIWDMVGAVVFDKRWQNHFEERLSGLLASSQHPASQALAQTLLAAA